MVEPSQILTKIGSPVMDATGGGTFNAQTLVLPQRHNSVQLTGTAIHVNKVSVMFSTHFHYYGDVLL